MFPFPKHAKVCITLFEYTKNTIIYIVRNLMFANYDQNAILVLMVLNLVSAVDVPRVWLHENTWKARSTANDNYTL